MYKKMETANLIDNLKAGHRKRIADKINCSPGTVTKILTGQQGNRSLISKTVIRMAKAIIKNDDVLERKLNQIKNQINDDNN